MLYPDYTDIFACFSTLLEATPTRHIWSFDPSAELPHTLFSDIRNNHSFQSLLSDRVKSTTCSTIVPALAETKADTKTGKEKMDDSADPLSWTSSFLLSLVESPPKALEHGHDVDTGFGEALAQVASFCLQDMQHERFELELKAAAAQAAFAVSFSRLRK